MAALLLASEFGTHRLRAFATRKTFSFENRPDSKRKSVNKSGNILRPTMSVCLLEPFCTTNTPTRTATRLDNGQTMKAHKSVC